MENLVKLSPEATAKVDRLVWDMRKEQRMVMLRSMLLCVASTIPIMVITVAENLVQTSFPMVSGFVTVLIIQHSYVKPRVNEIGEHYAEEVKKVIEDERRDQAQEG